MQQVFEGLYVGNQSDWELNIKNLKNDERDQWGVIQACKEPYHRQALGYTAKGCPKDHPNYLYVHNNGRLILNMVDAESASYFQPELIDTAMRQINHWLNESKKVLVHCNLGFSRAPVLAMLYLANTLPKDFTDAEQHFLSRYPQYQPNKGIKTYAEQNWPYYRLKRYLAEKPLPPTEPPKRGVTIIPV